MGEKVREAFIRSGLISPAGIPQKFKESSFGLVDSGGGYTPMDGVYLAGAAGYSNAVTGKNLTVGATFLVNPSVLKELDDYQNFFKKLSAVSLKYQNTELMFTLVGDKIVPRLSFGDLYYVYGGDVGIGIYSFSSNFASKMSYLLPAIVPFVLISAGIRNEDPKDAFREAAAALLDILVPTGSLCEIVNFFRKNFGKTDSKRLTQEEIESLAKEIGSNASRDRIETAIVKIRELLNSKNFDDPYIRASMRQLCDLLDLRTIEGQASDVSRNINEAVLRAREIRERWDSGERPSYKSVNEYLEMIGYLSLKLRLTTEISFENGIIEQKIIDNSAFTLTDPKEMTDYLKELSSAYSLIFDETSPLFKFMDSSFAKLGHNISERSRNVSALLKNIEANAFHFQMREAHIRFKMNRENIGGHGIDLQKIAAGSAILSKNISPLTNIASATVYDLYRLGKITHDAFLAGDSELLAASGKMSRDIRAGINRDDVDEFVNNYGKRQDHFREELGDSLIAAEKSLVQAGDVIAEVRSMTGEYGLQLKVLLEKMEEKQKQLLSSFKTAAFVSRKSTNFMEPEESVLRMLRTEGAIQNELDRQNLAQNELLNGRDGILMLMKQIIAITDPKINPTDSAKMEEIWTAMEKIYEFLGMHAKQNQVASNALGSLIKRKAILTTMVVLKIYPAF